MGGCNETYDEIPAKCGHCRTDISTVKEMDLHKYCELAYKLGESHQRLRTLEEKHFFQGSVRNPWLNKVLSRIAQLHDKKNHDYTPDDKNPFFNFEFSALYESMSSGHLEPDVFASFNTLEGTKIARIYSLCIRHENPQNEAFSDSKWDFVVYFLLQQSYKLFEEDECHQTGSILRSSF